MAETRSVPLRSAEAGGYGARAYDPVRERALAMLECVRTELHGAEWFTRDDLCRLSCFGDVAFITAYRYVGEAVDWLLRQRPRELVRIKDSRTELALRGDGKGYETPLDLANSNMQEIKRKALDCAMELGGTVTVADVLQAWKPSGDTLAPNVRRAAIRTALRRMAMGGVLLRTAKPGAYVPAPE